MSKPPPARYRTTNWPSYTGALRKRGSMLILMDKDMAWLAPHEGRLGRPPVFSDTAVQFGLSIKGGVRPGIGPGDQFSPERAEPRAASSWSTSMRHRFDHDVDAANRGHGGRLLRLAGLD